MSGFTCHEGGPTWGTLRLDVVLLQDDALLRKASHRWGLQRFVLNTLQSVKRFFSITSKKTHVSDLHSWIVPGHIVEPKIVGKNENNMGLPVVFGEITVIRGVRTTYLWYLVKQLWY